LFEGKWEATVEFTGANTFFGKTASLLAVSCFCILRAFLYLTRMCECCMCIC